MELYVIFLYREQDLSILGVTSGKTNAMKTNAIAIIAMVRTHSRKLVLCLLWALLAVGNWTPSQAQTGPEYCYGQYALCAASTCELTGRKIWTRVVSPTGLLLGFRRYPEAVCTCPVMSGKFKASGANLGQMKGSCQQPGPGFVWSIYSPMPVPQAHNAYRLTEQDEQPLVQVCAAKPGRSFANCFGFKCVVNPETVNGVQMATCYCPTNDDTYGNPVPKGSSAFKNEAGQCDQNYCSLLPVSVPYSPSTSGPVCLGIPPPL